MYKFRNTQLDLTRLLRCCLGKGSMPMILHSSLPTVRVCIPCHVPCTADLRRVSMPTTCATVRFTCMNNMPMILHCVLQLRIVCPCTMTKWNKAVCVTPQFRIPKITLRYPKLVCCFPKNPRTSKIVVHSEVKIFKTFETMT